MQKGKKCRPTAKKNKKEKKKNLQRQQKKEPIANRGVC